MKSEIKEAKESVELSPALYQSGDLVVLVGAISGENMSGVVVAEAKGHKEGVYSSKWMRNTFTRCPKGTQVILTQE